MSLTPLGVHGLRTFVLERGGEAPVVEDVSGLPAQRAARQIFSATPELARELTLEWLAPRERVAALASTRPCCATSRPRRVASC